MRSITWNLLTSKTIWRSISCLNPLASKTSRNLSLLGKLVKLFLLEIQTMKKHKNSALDYSHFHSNLNFNAGLRSRSRCRSRSWSRSSKESEVFVWSRSRAFVRLQLRLSNWIIFYTTLLNWEFLLKWYTSFWNRDSFLCTTITIDCNSQISFPLCWGVGVGTFGKVGVGVWNFGKVGVAVEVGYFTFDSTTLLQRI